MKKNKLLNSLEKRYREIRDVPEPIFNKPKRYKIDYPKHSSEAEIQAELWKILKNIGYDVRLEVVHLREKNITNKLKRVKSRFDLVVFDNKKAVCIIEVKKDIPIRNKQLKGAKHHQSYRQIEKYAKYEAELVFCIGERSINKTIEKVEEIMAEHNYLTQI